MEENEGYQKLHLRLPRTLYWQVKKYAEQSHRSFTNAACYLLTKALETEQLNNDDSEEHRDAVHSRGAHGMQTAGVDGEESRSPG